MGKEKKNRNWFGLSRLCGCKTLKGLSAQSWKQWLATNCSSVLALSEVRCHQHLSAPRLRSLEHGVLFRFPCIPHSVAEPSSVCCCLAQIFASSPTCPGFFVVLLGHAALRLPFRKAVLPRNFTFSCSLTLWIWRSLWAWMTFLFSAVIFRARRSALLLQVNAMGKLSQSGTVQFSMKTKLRFKVCSNNSPAGSSHWPANGSIWPGRGQSSPSRLSTFAWSRKRKWNLTSLIHATLHKSTYCVYPIHNLDHCTVHPIDKFTIINIYNIYIYISIIFKLFLTLLYTRYVNTIIWDTSPQAPVRSVAIQAT